MMEVYCLLANGTECLELTLSYVNRYDENKLKTKKYHKIPGNKWHHLATLFKRIINQNLNMYLENSNFVLKFQFKSIINFQDRNSQTQLGIDVENMLNNSLYSDVIIKSTEGYEYKVHKNILASRSDVLKAHFEHNTIECQTNIIESPLEDEILMEVLTFIYSDKAPRVNEIPEQLLSAANYYQLSRLKSLCEEELRKRLTVENAIETLQLAELQSAETLKQLTLEFIKDGNAQLITETEGWAKINSIELLKTIHEYLWMESH
ncbi:LOW QUALITY PROTEIN: speckle-type POZ protein-like [Bicyclus anynana]|uniref:LOW QUALITY PROTEIN: speckle-type POZ protein-like n=1 Tax=Bicyclus anynana TaxID=110368 RepID=A0ABM3M081_BICAN|nr:LOW QUALITY PROTEIN: speckle-type POZ protein-like [Bicyclus anynana]